MRHSIVRVSALAAIFALVACSSGSVGGLPPQSAPVENAAALPSDALVGPSSGEVPFQGINPVRAVCPKPTSSEQAQCFAMIRTDITPHIHLAQDVQPANSCGFSQGYCASDLEEAYNLPSSTKGSGSTVAIVDAYGYKHAASDLAAYRSMMGLYACGSCLRIVNQNGQTSPLPSEPPPNDDWKVEQSLDLDMVAAICPHCKIILVQTNNDYTNSLYPGEQTAGRLGAKYISNSWGGSEGGGDNPIFHQSGVVITAAAGDEGGGKTGGGGPSQPCSYTYVVCVGGTHLSRASNQRGWSETVWNDWNLQCVGGPCGATGSGCSAVIAKPAWQHDSGCTKRSEADVSASAANSAPVIIHNSEEGGSGWFLVGGTSESTPIIAAVYALAGNAGSQNGPEGVWKHHSKLNDVKTGNNINPGHGPCASSVVYICTARVGFDGPTGWGSPEGIGAF